ncbi:MAG TPA: class I SAM-dependent methyltransferase [Gaiellaceae bacterium]|nr:class I SAM-dependent methyltransferase [Gaiellaceae bacterium]
MEREDWNRKHGEAGLLFGADPNRFLVAEAESLPPRRALDVACGAGRNAVWLATQGWTVTGVDFSDVALANARRLAAERGVEVEWVQADVRQWSPDADEFDLVVVLYLQLPADERRRALRNATAALAPGGTLLVVGHHAENLRDGWGGPKDPWVLFTPEEIAADLAGLEIEKAERVLRPVEDEDGEHDAIDALVRARR